ncbi:MAG: hypothetical protein ACOYJU_04970 [Anaerovoracaceae bacterium]|jgi:fido (protein-threonine AMPylation protein)
MMAALKDKGYKRATLGVSKENCAVRMYRNVVLEIAGDGRSMRIQLDQMLKKELRFVVDWRKIEREEVLPIRRNRNRLFIQEG